MWDFVSRALRETESSNEFPEILAKQLRYITNFLKNSKIRIPPPEQQTWKWCHSLLLVGLSPKQGLGVEGELRGTEKQQSKVKVGGDGGGWMVWEDCRDSPT